jgi:hypothetical protein
VVDLFAEGERKVHLRTGGFYVRGRREKFLVLFIHEAVEDRSFSKRFEILTVRYQQMCW